MSGLPRMAKRGAEFSNTALYDWPPLSDPRERRIEAAEPKPFWGGVIFLGGMLLSGAIFAGAIYLMIWAFALLEAVLT